MGTKVDQYSLNRLVDDVKVLARAGNKFCFILGAGASISSGIKSGEKMARDWYDYLQKHEPDKVNALAIDTSNIGRHYSQLYKMRFDHPHSGYIWLQNAMEHAKPSLGYYHLASLLANEPSINMVITTNFDSLTEDAISLFTMKKPLVVSHESLAPYLGDAPNRPIVAKIHRDLLLRPMSTPEETEQIKDNWSPVLKDVFRSYSIIVVGYGGNDGSLMNLLQAAAQENRHNNRHRIYWCHMRNDQPQSDGILNLLRLCDGRFVPIDGFDETMYLLGRAFEHKFNEDALRERLQAHIDGYNVKKAEIESLATIKSNWKRICASLPPMARSVLARCDVNVLGEILHIICDNEVEAHILRDKNRPLLIRETLADMLQLSKPPSIRIVAKTPNAPD